LPAFTRVYTEASGAMRRSALIEGTWRRAALTTVVLGAVALLTAAPSARAVKLYR